MPIIITKDRGAICEGEPLTRAEFEALPKSTAEWGRIVFAVLPDGRCYLVDGRHRIAAAIEADVAIELELVGVACKDMAEVDRLHRNIKPFDGSPLPN